MFGLARGAYVISAEPDPVEVQLPQLLSSVLSAGGFIDPRALTGEKYPAVFYPGITDRDAATLIKIAAGAKIEAIDLTLIR